MQERGEDVGAALIADRHATVGQRPGPPLHRAAVGLAAGWDSTPRRTIRS